jgi:hypothetical protein
MRPEAFAGGGLDRLTVLTYRHEYIHMYCENHGGGESCCHEYGAGRSLP